MRVSWTMEVSPPLAEGECRSPETRFQELAKLRMVVGIL